MITSRDFPLGPIGFVCAIAGSLLCIYSCIALCQTNRKFVQWLCFFGKNSIWVFVLHTLDEIWVYPLQNMFEHDEHRMVWLFGLLALRIAADSGLACLFAAAFTRLRARLPANKMKE